MPVNEICLLFFNYSNSWISELPINQKLKYTERFSLFKSIPFKKVNIGEYQ